MTAALMCPTAREIPHENKPEARRVSNGNAKNIGRPSFTLGRLARKQPCLRQPSQPFRLSRKFPRSAMRMPGVLVSRWSKAMRLCRLVLIPMGVALLGLPEGQGAAPVPFGGAEKHKSVDAPLPAGAIARLGTSRLRHGGIVMALSFTQGGKLFSVGMDGSLRLWEPTAGGEIWCLDCPPQFLPQCAALSPDGKFAAASSSLRDKPVHLWDTATRKLCLLPVKPRRSVNFFAFSPDSKTLATVEGGRLICLWDVRTGNLGRAAQARTDVREHARFFSRRSMDSFGRGTGRSVSVESCHGRTGARPPYSVPGFCHCLCADGKTFAATDGTGVVLWDSAGGAHPPLRGPPAARRFYHLHS